MTTFFFCCLFFFVFFILNNRLKRADRYVLFAVSMLILLLFISDIDVNQSTPFGRTPLHAAAARDHLGVLDLLLKYGASIRRTDCYGFSAVDVAKEMSSDQCAKRFRVLLLNLRGGVGQNTSRDIRSGTSLSDKKSASRFDLPHMPSRSNTVGEIQTHSTIPPDVRRHDPLRQCDTVSPST